MSSRSEMLSEMAALFERLADQSEALVDGNPEINEATVEFIVAGLMVSGIDGMRTFLASYTRGLFKAAAAQVRARGAEAQPS